MEGLLWMAATMGCGLIGAFVGKKLKLPSGIMIGALIGAAAFSILSGKGYMPTTVKVFTQSVSGIFIGMKIKRSDLPTLRRIILPAFCSAGLMIFLCSCMGLLVGAISGVDAKTAILGCAPGGIVDMSLIAMDVGGDTAVISVLHVIRLIAVLGIFPPLLRTLIKKIGLMEHIETESKPDTEAKAEDVHETKLKKPMRILLTAIVGGIFGLIGRLTGIPAGTLLFSMVGTALFGSITSAAYMPPVVKRGAQWLAGTLIGINVTVASLIGLKSLILPAMMMLVLYFIINFVIAIFLHKVFKLELMTAFFSCTPGGASDICLMVEDFGGDTPKISIMQTMRVIIVTAAYPMLIQMF